MRVVIITFALALLSGCNCGETHSPDAGMDAPRPPPVDSAIDGAVDTRFPIDFVGDAGCERIHGYRVCGERCLAPCTASEGRCLTSLGVCFGPRGTGYGCDYTRWGGSYCGDGRICAPVTGEFDIPEASDDGLQGACIDADFCADLPTLGLGSSQCQYSDGTMFVTGPPALDVCPPSNPALQFCGGPCAGVICPEEGGAFLNRNCLGVSDNRAFGVCGRSDGLNCRQGWSFNGPLLEYCRSRIGKTGAPDEACGCIVPRPQAEGLDAEMGWPVPLSVCRTYRDLNPGHADCVDADWNPVL